MTIVELTPLEAKAHEMTKNVPDIELRDELTLRVFGTLTQDPTQISKYVDTLLPAAQSARRKIAAATAYEIRVVEE